jgi:O-antigen/teichoic acid export membrane protein
LSGPRYRRLGRAHQPSAPLEGDGVASRERHDDAVAHILRGLFGRDSLYMFMWALQLAAAAALTPLVTRVMGTDEFGAVATAIAVMQVLFVVAGLGLRTAIQRQYAGSGGPIAAARLLLLTLVLASVVTVLVDSTGGVWSGHVGFESYGDTLRLTVYWAGVAAVTDASLALLRSQDRLLAFSCVSLLQSVVAAAASLLLVAVVRPTATMFLLGQLVVQIVAAVLGLYLAPPRLPRPRNWKLASDALLYGLPLVPAVLCTFVLAAADRLIVQAELGLTAVARYQVAYNVGAIPMILLGVLSTTWMPRIFALDRPTERAAVLAASQDALYRLLTPVLMGLSIGSPLVLRLWAPPEYRPDDLLLVTSIVIVSAVPYTAALNARRALLAEGRSAAIAAANGVAAATNIVLNLILVPQYELVGSAAATFLAYAVLHGLLLWRAGTMIRMRKPPLRLLEVTGAVIVALLAAALPTTSAYLALRSMLVVASLAWFGWILMQVTGRRPTRGANPGAHASSQH